MTALVLWMIVRRTDKSLSLEGKVAAKENSALDLPLISRLRRQPFLWSAFGGYSTRPGMRRGRIPASGSLPKGEPI